MNKNLNQPPAADSDRRQFESNLRTRMQQEVIDLPTPAGPAATVRRARAITRRNRVVAGVAVAFSFLVGITAVGQLRDSTDSVQVASPGTDDNSTVDDPASDAGATPGVANGPIDFAWTLSEGGLSTYVGPYGRTSTESLYMISTAPGTTIEQYPNSDAPTVLYKLDDSGQWQPVSGDETAGLSRITELDGILYGLSTASGTGESTSYSGTISTDGGATWTETALGVSEPPSVGEWWLIQRTSLTNTDGGAVAVVSNQFTPDPSSLFPANKVGVNEYLDARMTETGFDAEKVTYPTEEQLNTSPDAFDETSRVVVGSATWAELGVTGPAELADISIYRVQDGEWLPQSSPELAIGESLGRVSSVNGKLFATVESAISTYGPANPDLSGQIGTVTDDGIEWHATGAPSYWDVQALGNKLIGRDYTNGTDALMVSKDEGLTWNRLDTSIVPSPDGFFGGVYVGPLGMLIASVGQSDPMAYFTSDLSTWTEIRLDGLIDGVDLSSGEFLGIQNAVVGPDRVAITIDRTGPGVVTLVGSPTR